MTSDEIYLSNYATINVLTALKRIPGIGRVRNTGSRSYSMRVWLRPDTMAGYGLTVSDFKLSKSCINVIARSE